MKALVLGILMLTGLQLHAAQFSAATTEQDEQSVTVDDQPMFLDQAQPEENATAFNRPPPIPIPGQCVCYVEDWYRRVYEGRDWDCRRAERDALARCERYSPRCYYMGCERRNPFPR